MAITTEHGADFGDGSMSELARQLRLLQATNKQQATQIDGLQRQIQIMSELSGVSVADLRSTLKNACESRANEELRMRVALLESQIEEEKIRQERTEDLFSEKFAAESESRRIANFELRIGELQELHESDKREISDLYEEVEATSSESCRLHIQCEEQERTIAELQAKLKRSGEYCTELVISESQTNHYAEGLAPVRASEECTDLIIATSQKREEELSTIRILKQKVKQREEELSLKDEQYKARFSLQDGQISDLEQQLSSLYVAYRIVENERSEEQATREQLTKSLYAADEQYAKTFHQGSENNAEYFDSTQSSSTHTPPSPAMDNLSVSSPSFASSLSSTSVPVNTFASSDATPSRAPVTIQSSQHSISTPTNPGSFGDSQGGNNRRKPAPPQEVETVVVAGPVLKRGNLGRWKKRHGRLCQRANYSILQLHEAPGTTPSTQIVIAGNSKFERVNDFAQHPFCLRVIMDMNNPSAPTLVLALDSDSSFKHWYKALVNAKIAAS